MPLLGSSRAASRDEPPMRRPTLCPVTYPTLAGYATLRSMTCTPSVAAASCSCGWPSQVPTLRTGRAGRTYTVGIKARCLPNPVVQRISHARQWQCDWLGNASMCSTRSPRRSPTAASVCHRTSLCGRALRPPSRVPFATDTHPAACVYFMSMRAGSGSASTHDSVHTLQCT